MAKRCRQAARAARASARPGRGGEQRECGHVRTQQPVRRAAVAAHSLSAVPPPPPQQQQQTSAQPSAPEPPAHSAALPSGVRIHGAENVSSEVLASLVGRAKLAGAQVTARSEADAESSVGGDVAAELAATSELQGTGDLVLDQLVSGLLATPCIRKRLDQLYGRAPSRSSSQINVAQLDNTGVNSLSDYRGYNLPSSPLLGGALTESQRSSLAGGGHEPHDDEPSL